MEECRKTARIESARQCAPVLAGIKPSNLLILERAGAFELMEVMDGTGLSFEYLYGGKRKSVWLVYWLEEIETLLKDARVREFLMELGYRRFQVPEVFRFLKQRYGEYLNRGACYPHELGLLLGYPLGDVRGFMEHKGKNYLYSGYWKVYGDAEHARKIFAMYRMVRREAERLAGEGKGLWEMIAALSSGERALAAF